MLIGCCKIGSYYAGAHGRADVKSRWVICTCVIGKGSDMGPRKTRPIKWDKAREAPALARVGKRVSTGAVGEQPDCHMPGSTRRLASEAGQLMARRSGDNG
jgi:hypothetical protein